MMVYDLSFLELNPSQIRILRSLLGRKGFRTKYYLKEDINILNNDPNFKLNPIEDLITRGYVIKKSFRKKSGDYYSITEEGEFALERLGYTIIRVFHNGNYVDGNKVYGGKTWIYKKSLTKQEFDELVDLLKQSCSVVRLEADWNRGFINMRTID